VTVATAYRAAYDVGGCSWVERAGALALILGSACTAPLFMVAGLTLTGDRLLGLAALGIATALSVAGRLRWTPIHSALAVFVGAQIVTTILNAAAWPQGLKFVTVYLLGFACFCLADEAAHRRRGQRRLATWWIAAGAVLGVLATVLAMWANLFRRGVWGTGIVQVLVGPGRHLEPVFASKVTFGEWNLLSSFLLIPLALGLWVWRRESNPGGSGWRVPAALTAVVLGLAFGFTRAAWLSTAGIIAFWWWRQRPPWRQLVAVAAMLALAALLQMVVLHGRSPIRLRMVNPVIAGYDWNMAGRLAISKVTVASWLERPVLGQGAGAMNRLSVVLASGKRIEKIWNGNLVLFVLHDSGVLGFATLVGLGVAVWRRGAGAIRSGAAGATSPVALPLLAVGAALCFAYQFTHGLWIMYPYVYLGFLTAATDHGQEAYC
jgi:hypothetical protein